MCFIVFSVNAVPVHLIGNFIEEDNLNCIWLITVDFNDEIIISEIPV